MAYSTILHFVPVISTTSSLWFAWDQYEFLTLFRKPDLRGLSNELLPSYFTSFFNRGAPRVLALLTTTVISCGSILRYSPSTILRDSAPWYIAGLSFALGHQVFVPFILPSIQAIKNDGKEKNVAELESWLRVHTWRSLTVDLAAWVCCIVAASKSLAHD
ncbi:putative integral membrane protein [Hypoxylon trugodes]|uniref:putative integral membrane protein n=1 Tax=Hypoxylon trugodes TaxID=326681 RepID=UPI00218D9BE6|nr:putative integral membrane protein [Hypoxylon trugodes]KAI1383550.1 putative integral membrane protein [Hypoxylon trugodes]